MAREMTLRFGQLVLMLVMFYKMTESTHPPIKSVIFQRHHQVYTTKSHWFISTEHNIDSYNTSLDNIDDSLSKVSSMVKGIIERMESVSKGTSVKFRNLPYIKQFKLTSNDISHLCSLQLKNRKQHKELLNIINPGEERRIKRGVLPLGGFFKDLFGTASDKDVKKIMKAVKELRKTQELQGSVLSESVSLINLTREDVQENRHRINELVNATKYLMEQTKRITSVETELKMLKTFVISHTEIKTLVSEIRDNINRLRSNMKDLKLTLSALGMSELVPSLIAPSKLKEVLIDIQDKIPENLQLPIRPSKDLFHYYKYLTCESFVTNGKLYTITVVPLLDMSTKYDLFELHNLAIPDTALNMSVSYVLEQKYIAISESGQHFSPLSEYDYYKCASSYNHYCTFNSPLYPSNKHQFCVMALYRNSSSEIRKYCQVEFSKLLVSRAVYVGKGLWTLLLLKPEKLKITCLDKPSQNVIIKGPIEMIQLNQSCTGYTDSFILPPYFEGHTQITNEIGEAIDQIKISKTASDFQIWQALNITKQEDKKFVLKKLDPVKKYSVKYVNTALQAYLSPEENDDWSVLYWLLSFDLPMWGIIICFIVVIVVWYKYPDKFRKLYPSYFRRNEQTTGDPAEIVELNT